MSATSWILDLAEQQNIHFISTTILARKSHQTWITSIFSNYPIIFMSFFIHSRWIEDEQIFQNTFFTTLWLFLSSYSPMLWTTCQLEQQWWSFMMWLILVPVYLSLLSMWLLSSFKSLDTWQCSSRGCTLGYGFSHYLWFEEFMKNLKIGMEV